MKRHKARLAAVVVVRYLVDEFRVVGRAHGNTGFVFTLANWTDHSCSSFRLLFNLCASAYVCVKYLPRQTLTQRSAEIAEKNLNRSLSDFRFKRYLIKMCHLF